MEKLEWYPNLFLSKAFRNNSEKRRWSNIFSFKITNYIPPTKQQIKEHYKKNQYFEYTGTVEYLLDEFSPTAEDIAKKSFFVHSDPRTDITPIINRRTSCIIQIAPYKKLPQLYNIWFDNIGYAIDLRNMIFSND